MRQGQQNKRMRGRGRKGPNPLTRSFESNGPDVKIRGTAQHIAEKYVQLARDAQTSGDRVAGESYLQHAEHFNRIVAAAQTQLPPPQQIVRDNGQEEQDSGAGDSAGSQPNGQGQQPSFGLSDPQPFVNGNGQAESEGDGVNALDENRTDGREQTARRDNRDHAGPRSRRRRPYRERADSDKTEAHGEISSSSENPEPVAETIPTEE